MNAIDLLVKQHTDVAQAFVRARSSRGEEHVRVLGEIVEALTIHNAIEEQYLYPAYRRYGLPEAAALSIQEHQQMRELLGQLLELRQNDPRLVDVVDQLDAAMREHVGKEQGELFPWMRSRASEEELDDMGNAMEQLARALRRKELLKLAERRESPLQQA